MNILKLGSVLQSAQTLRNQYNTMISGGTFIHYAKYRKHQGGTVRGTVLRFTECNLSEAPLLGIGLIKLFNPLVVTRSHSVSNRDCKTRFKILSNPWYQPLAAASNPEKILFRLLNKYYSTRQTLAAIGLKLDFCRQFKKILFLVGKSYSQHRKIMNRLQENVVFAQGGLYSPPSTSKSYPHIHGPKPSDCGARAAGRRWGAKRGCGYVGNSMLTALVFPKCSAEPIESLKLPAREAAPKGCRVYVSGSLQSSTVTAASISEAQRSDPHPPTGAFCSPERIDGGQNGILSKSCRSSFTPPDPKEPLNTLLLRGIFRAYCGLCVFLFHIGAPAWVVNSVPLLIPSALRRAAARVYLDGHLKNNAGGQP